MRAVGGGGWLYLNEKEQGADKVGRGQGECERNHGERWC